MCIEQIELPSKLLDYFLWSIKSNNQYICICMCMNVYMIHAHAQHVWASIHTHTRTREPVELCLMRGAQERDQMHVLSNHVAGSAHTCTHTCSHICTHTHARAQATIHKDEAAAGKSSPSSHSYSLTTPPFFVDEIYNPQLVCQQVNLPHPPNLLFPPLSHMPSCVSAPSLSFSFFCFPLLAQPSNHCSFCCCWSFLTP